MFFFLALVGPTDKQIVNFYSTLNKSSKCLRNVVTYFHSLALNRYRSVDQRKSYFCAESTIHCFDYGH